MATHIRKTLYLVSTLFLLGVGSAQAAFVQFNIPLSGATEVPGPGDADGSGLAIIRLDGVTNTINWAITVNNIAPVTGAHIHQGAIGTAGPIVIDFNGQLNGSNLVDADVSNVLANPLGFYVNIHNADFPSGAVRGQICPTPIPPTPVPVPAAAWLLGSGLMGFVGFMRRRNRKTA